MENFLQTHDRGRISTSTQLTIVILTLNEERDLPACLNAIPEQYPVVILDSGSTDNTIEIANRRSCKVFYHAWLGFTEQRNYALEYCNITTLWVLFIDADEIYHESFFNWFGGNLGIINRKEAWMVPQDLYWRNKKLRHAPAYPFYHPRLLKTNVRLIIHHAGTGEALPVELNLGYAPVGYKHYYFDGNVHKWLEKHLNLAYRQSQVTSKIKSKLTNRARLSLLMGNTIWRIPVRFIYHYILRAGFLDGAAGFEYSLMYAWFELTKYLERHGLPRQSL